MKNVHSKWFSSIAGSVGIVYFEDEKTDKKRAFIGTCGKNSETEEIDVKRIVEFGSKFPVKVAMELMCNN